MNVFRLETNPIPRGIKPPLYGAQNEVYNDDWVKSGLIVLCFS